MSSVKVVGVGACVFDTLISVPHYPEEDTKLRANSVETAGGGPTATGIVAAAKLGASSAFIGNLSDDNGGKFLFEDFIKYGVSTEFIKVEKGYRSFTSTVILSEKTASRTCVFDKGSLPPAQLSESQKTAVKNADILMIDGNEIDAAEEACKIAKISGTKVLYDCGGLYDGVERLLVNTDVMIPSKEFALKHTGKSGVNSAAAELYSKYKPMVVVITCGKDGGILFDGKEYFKYPAMPVPCVADSNGSGDVFHGAFAAGMVKGYTYKKCCLFASAVAALKCTGLGARASIPCSEDAVNLLKENGYEL